MAVSTRSKTSLIRAPRAMTIFGGAESVLLATTSIEPADDCPTAAATAVTSAAVTAPLWSTSAASAAAW